MLHAEQDPERAFIRTRGDLSQWSGTAIELLDCLSQEQKKGVHYQASQDLLFGWMYDKLSEDQQKIVKVKYLEMDHSMPLTCAIYEKLQELRMTTEQIHEEILQRIPMCTYHDDCTARFNRGKCSFQHTAPRPRVKPRSKSRGRTPGRTRSPEGPRNMTGERGRTRNRSPDHARHPGASASSVRTPAATLTPLPSEQMAATATARSHLAQTMAARSREDSTGAHAPSRAPVSQGLPFEQDLLAITMASRQSSGYTRTPVHLGAGEWALVVPEETTRR